MFLLLITCQPTDIVFLSDLKKRRRFSIPLNLLFHCIFSHNPYLIVQINIFNERLFIYRYPKETLDLILSDNNIKDQQWSRFLVFLIKHSKAGPPYRDALQTTKKPRLMQLLAANTGGTATNLPTADRAEMQFQAIRVISLLIKFDEKWLSGQPDLIELLKRIWCSDTYHVSIFYTFLF